jgi:hypothetical protein
MSLRNVALPVGDLYYYYFIYLVYEAIGTAATPGLTPYSWFLLEKLSVDQVFKNFPTCYEIRRFIAVFTRAFRRFLS